MAVLYIASPVDLIPEVLAGPLGLTDDLASFGVLLLVIKKYIVQKQMANLEIQRRAQTEQYYLQQPFYFSDFPTYQQKIQPQQVVKSNTIKNKRKKK